MCNGTRLHRPITNNLMHYYCSLENRLANTFHMNISIVPVFADGNCLYRALSHIIFGTESKFEMLKQNLIGRFMSSPQHFPNVMEKSGLFSEQELHEHVQRISAPHAWGTDVQLRMLGALAGIDVVSIIATDSDCNNWRLDPVYIHGQLTSPIVCDSTYHGQKLGIVYHCIHHHVGSEHFDPFYLVAQ